MTSFESSLTESFTQLFAKLPTEIRERARKSYRLWKVNPGHPSLHFKKIHSSEPLYSVRVTKGWRVLGLLEGNRVTWFWIGSHADYDHLIAQLR